LALEELEAKLMTLTTRATALMTATSIKRKLDLKRQLLWLCG
jgi:hypothetical protein